MFQARNRHNLEQSTKLAQNKELLNKRNAQVTVMDQRIGDLRERLHKKKAEVRNSYHGSFFLIVNLDSYFRSKSVCLHLLSWVGWMEEACPPLRPPLIQAVESRGESQLSVPTSRFRRRGDRRRGTHHPNQPRSATSAPSQVGRRTNPLLQSF